MAGGGGEQPAAAQPAPAAEKPSAGPKRGGTLILGVEGEPASLTAHLATDTAAINAYYEQFEGMLVTFPAILSSSHP